MSIDENVVTCLYRLQRGGMIAVTDAESRENEADIVIAAQHITQEQMTFLIRYTSGIICVAMTEERLKQLGIPLLQSNQPARFGTPFAMPVDYTPGTTSGVSASDRVATIQALMNPQVDPRDFGMPGHMFPLKEAAGGLKERRGHTEASIQLARMAECQPMAVIGELMNDDGTMMRGRVLTEFLEQQDIPLCSIDQIVQSL